jgi:two-component system sensor histidine kinase KdpD
MRQVAHLDPLDMQDALRDLRRESKRLQRIIENLLVMARLDAGEVFGREPLLVRDLLVRRREGHNRAYPARKVVVNAEADLPAILGHETYLQLVLRNLMSNAEKYTPAGETIEMDCCRHGARVRIVVRDRGRGLSPTALDELFTPFHRPSADADRIPGLGIGLAVCRRLIEAHGGKMWAQPRAGGGSDFGFDLPPAG